MPGIILLTVVLAGNLRTQTVAADCGLVAYVPAYANPAIFATDDMGGDEAMGGVLLDILIVIIAFIFAVTISNTITRETPVIVTLIAAAVGNVLGYSVNKGVAVSMYYNSYSLSVYETMWSDTAPYKNVTWESQGCKGNMLTYQTIGLVPPLPVGRSVLKMPDKTNEGKDIVRRWNGSF